MCGIVGYVGEKSATPILMEGLKLLEYRGYDSAGIAVQSEKGKINIVKKEGKIEALQEIIGEIEGKCGIGHTRWATHGKPNNVNSHPHKCGKFVVVHNGIIENFLDLKIDLVNNGAKFKSQTDTEVIAQLLNHYYNGDFLSTTKTVLEKLAGSFALAIMCEDFPNQILVVKMDSPLIIGFGKGENYLASDIPALINHTQEIYVMQDADMAILTPNKVTFYDEMLSPIQKEHKFIDYSSCPMELGKYETFMKKEIFEVPNSIENTIKHFLKQEEVNGLKNIISKVDRIMFIGCGSAYHSTIVGKYTIESLARVPCDAEIASEFRYKNPILSKNTLYIFVSQSGETADTIMSAKLVKQFGAPIAVVTNVSTSNLTTYADLVFPTMAGIERGVAATKSYSSQVAVMYCIALTIAEVKVGLNSKPLFDEMLTIPKKINEILSDLNTTKNLAEQFANKQSIFFIGRGLDYAVSLEGSLKLKEISYIHSEGYAAGELKHGTLALIDKNSLVVAIISQKNLAEKTLNAVHEVSARKAHVEIFTTYEKYAIEDKRTSNCILPEINDLFSPLLTVVPLQIFAYYMARARGCDPDKPRNLAKSVTVE